ncbi:hypothetical protein [Granulicella aggregans]|uniref:hypothetical protein n=1 Tax=Granulicella aggregans TaxID=474949 RepID=UPI001C863B10|nr:hypothetical protein [Granulicella aggregans]
MHYVVFLQKQGLIPYRDIVDINLPGTYLFEEVAMRSFGAGAFGWRLYDCFLLVSVLGSAMVLAGKRNLFAGIFSALIFVLVHLQDGIAQGGQRDLLMTALLLWAYVALFQVQRAKRAVWMALLYGLLIGATATIKPVLLPLGLVLLLALGWIAHRRGLRVWSLLSAGAIGIIIPVGAVLLWLKWIGAFQSFLSILTGLLPLHAQMGRKTLSFLLSHALSPVALLAALWLVLQVLERRKISAEKAELMIGIVGTAVAYIAQGKGYPYQRYPLLAILLVLIGMDLNRALDIKGAIGRFAMATCILSSFVFAPRYAWLTTTFSNTTPFQDALSERLLGLDSPTELSGHVQCLDTFGGCINSLYDLQIRQSTGFIYDCYLFSSESTERERYRTKFWNSYQLAKPRVVVETNQFCFGDARGFDKLATWPLLDEDIRQKYEMKSAWRSQVLQHWWSRREEPSEFKLYVRKPGVL